ncbi:MAG: histidinol dehydrogenase [Armatimonadetes bacterium]|nr:histidinol dehydrogenase [Armatimonadota bacterium]MDE2208009.1 histidinol dehydrogenase [Armatimonadota bacterium]
MRVRQIEVKRDGWDVALAALQRPAMQADTGLEDTVRGIIRDVRLRGDVALLELGRKFDAPDLNALVVEPEDLDRAEAAVDPALADAIRVAAANIRAFHARQRENSWSFSSGGVTTGQLIRPLQRVGVYVPGGTALYPSTVLMTVIPAREAGVEEVVLCTPAQKDGSVSPAVLYAASIAGARLIIRAGGAQALAAMAFGTESVPRVDKVVGPGNLYVNIAKRLLYGHVDVDMLAGPSEVCVLADGSASARFVAADMLTQAEHDGDAAAFLITPSAALASAVQAAIERALVGQPRRAILERALLEHGALIVGETMAQCIDLANRCAPEHLALMVEDPWRLLPSIRSAGAILMGRYTPQALGDYIAGPSHCLPTAGTARFSSPLSVESFLKRTSVVDCSIEALRELAGHITAFARGEGFEAHAQGVEVRLEEPET